MQSNFSKVYKQQIFKNPFLNLFINTIDNFILCMNGKNIKVSVHDVWLNKLWIHICGNIWKVYLNNYGINKFGYLKANSKEC